MEQELTMEELIALINNQKGDFVIRVPVASFAGEEQFVVFRLRDLADLGI